MARRKSEQPAPPAPKSLLQEFDEAVASLVNGFQARGLSFRNIARVLRGAEEDCYDLAIEANIQNTVWQSVALALQAERERERLLKDAATVAQREASGGTHGV